MVQAYSSHSARVVSIWYNREFRLTQCFAENEVQYQQKDINDHKDYNSKSQDPVLNVLHNMYMHRLGIFLS